MAKVARAASTAQELDTVAESAERYVGYNASIKELNGSKASERKTLDTFAKNSGSMRLMPDGKSMAFIANGIKIVRQKKTEEALVDNAAAILRELGLYKRCLSLDPEKVLHLRETGIITAEEAERLIKVGKTSYSLVVDSKISEEFQKKYADADTVSAIESGEAETSKAALKRF